MNATDDAGRKQRPGTGDGAAAPAGSESVHRRVWEALATVADPEIPVVSVVELGMIAGVEAAGDGIVVRLTPTFAGCPALDLLRVNARQAVLDAGISPVRVEIVFDPPWTTDRISPEGLRKLREFGLAPPPRCTGSPVSQAMLRQVACPYCNSTDTVLESIFGPTLCRAIHYCNACRQSFEQFKPVG